MDRPQDLVGQEIDRYKVVEYSSRGSMAYVYRAVDEDLERDVALKILLPRYTIDQDIIQRFLQEARLAAQLNHPNIVQIYTTGVTWQEDYYIAMEYVDGGTLRDWLDHLRRQSKRLPVDKALSLGRQIASALTVAHQVGIVHRDVKPDNILLREEGTPVLTDLGIAVVQDMPADTRKTLVGTLDYLSPEQAMDQPIDARTDIYSFGVVLYEMLAGQLPFANDSPLGALQALSAGQELKSLPQVRQDLTPETYQVVERCLHQDPNQRYQKTETLVEALDRALQAERFGSQMGSRDQNATWVDMDIIDTDVQQGIINMPSSRKNRALTLPPPPSPPSPPPPPSSKSGRFQPWMWGVVGLMVLLLIGGGLYFAGIIPGENSDALLARAQVAMEKGDYEQAEAVLTRLVTENPDDPALNLRLADLLLKQDNYTDALLYYDATLAQDDELVDAYLGAGQAAYEMDSFSRSLEYFSDAVAIAPGNAEAYAGQGKSYYALGWYEDAIAPLEKWATLEQQAAEPYQWLSLIYEESGDQQKRLETTTNWVERDPENAEAHNALGWSYYSLELFDDASTSFIKAIERDKTAFSAYRGLGHVYYAAGQYEEAIENYNKWLEYDPNNFSAYNSLGWSYYNTQQYTEALNAFSLALSLEPDSPGANQGLGYLYEHQGDYESAVSYYRNWANLSSSQVQPYSRLGWALFELEEYAEAIEAFEQVMLFDPADGSGYKGLAYSYKQLENDNKAYEYQLQWVDVAASDPEAHAQLGWTLYGRQDFEEAIRSFDMALSLDSEYYSALSGRGQAYFYSGENGCERAVPNFEAALRLRPDDDRIAELLARCEEQQE